MNKAVQTLALASGDTALILDPLRGGAVREFRWRGHDIFRPTPQDAGNDPLQYACFPMVPYANRIKEGCFTFDGQSVHLDTNWNGDRHPIHGEGWRNRWFVVEASSSAATIAFEGDDGEWPWIYRAEQHFHLRNDGLSMTLSVTNRSPKPMPAMLGLHPYFPGASKARLSARVPRVWQIENDWPAGETETPKGWCFDPPRSVSAVPLDHAFSGWDGTAEIIWQDHYLRLRATHCTSLQIYAPAQKDFFCVEPQTAAWGAINRGDADVVGPGKTLNVTVDFAMGGV